MKCFYVLSVVTLVAGMLSLDVSASPKKKPAPPKPGNVIAIGGNGGNANGKNSTGGAGGGAVAVGGNQSSGGNVIAVGGNGGNAKGKGSQGGAGGGAVAVGGNLSSGGNVVAVGGNGGNAKGPGSKGGNGGGAVAVGGNNNGTIINGNNNTIINNKNITFSPVFGGGGFGGGGFGGGGFGGGGAVVSNGAPGIAFASTPDQTVIAADGSPAIATSSPGNVNGDIADREEVFTRRFLKVKNDSDVAMKVFVQYRGFADQKWAWLPGDPSASQDALVYNLQPGQEVLVDHNSQKVSASRVRVWAVAQGQSWLDYRDQDLWIVPEVDQRGEHHYTATEMKTFTFIFPKLQK